ncbi:hypothetical protein GQ53DRAFT_830415 [Thozetella sp. PMI_491]|nr:hypothetical protein GQ53DRAFT_830415 [Thozetella sp. PMI_491]
MAEKSEKMDTACVSRTLSNVGSTPPQQSRLRRSLQSDLRSMSWWWWWEIGACATSIASMTLLLALLAIVNGTPTDSWALSIRPNSLISVSTTIARAAMMVSVTSCISQLKWKHYLRGPDRLSSLQIFDDASRGPWGALVALLTLRTKSTVMTALAALTLISIAIESMTQQILDSSQVKIALRNGTATIAIADSYVSASLLLDDTVTNNALLVRSALLRAITGDPFQPNLYCPPSAQSCSWKDFTTLAVCRDTRDISDQVRPNCRSVRVNGTSVPLNETRCQYNISMLDAVLELGTKLPEEITNVRFGGNQNVNGTDIINFQKTLYKSHAVRESRATGTLGYSGGASFIFLRYQDNRNVFDTELPKVEMVITRWYYCTKTFHNVVSDGAQLTVGSTSSEALAWMVGNANPLSFSRYRAPSTGTIYLITDREGGQGSIWNALANLLDNKQLWLHKGDSDQPFKREGTSDIDYGQFLYEAKYEEMLENVTMAATNLIRSGSPGDNLNSSVCNGKAYYWESVYVVRWEWLAVLLLNVIAITGLLGVSIWQTRDVPLLRTSVAAYLLHGLQGWSDSELGRLVSEKESLETLGKVSEGMVVSLTADSDGRLRLKKAL